MEQSETICSRSLLLCFGENLCKPQYLVNRPSRKILAAIFCRNAAEKIRDPAEGYCRGEFPFFLGSICPGSIAMKYFFFSKCQKVFAKSPPILQTGGKGKLFFDFLDCSFSLQEKLSPVHFTYLGKIWSKGFQSAVKNSFHTNKRFNTFCSPRTFQWENFVKVERTRIFPALGLGFPGARSIIARSFRSEPRWSSHPPSSTLSLSLLLPSPFSILKYFIYYPT